MDADKLANALRAAFEEEARDREMYFKADDDGWCVVDGHLHLQQFSERVVAKMVKATP